jgi:predicted DNA-binding protein YlxM (UPF0122 family)
VLLTRQQRRIWILRTFGRLGYSQIGREVGLPRQAVFTTIKRIEKKLEKARRQAEEMESLRPVSTEPSALFATDRTWGRMLRARRVT